MCAQEKDIKMESLESLLESTDVFKNEKYLRVGYHPKTVSEIKHRDDIIRRYLATLREVAQNSVPSNMLVFGKSGSGKSMITNVILTELKKVVAEKDIKMDYIHICCECFRSDSKILKELITQLEQLTNTEHPKLSNDIGVYFEWFCQLVTKYSGIMIIVLDEIDKMKNPNMINSFSRIVENKMSSHNICIIGITNNMEFTTQLNAKTLSAFAQDQIVFPPYNANQLYDILSDRAKMAFVPNTLDEEVIPLCAALAAQEHGDARKAIALLHAAGLNAREHFKQRVTEDDVYIARKIADKKNTYTLLKSLPLHPKLVLLSCAILDTLVKCEPHTTDIYSTYLQTCSIIKKEPLSQRRVSELIGELDEIGLVETSTYSLGRNGLKKKVKCTQTPDIIDTILEDDSLAEIINPNNCIPTHLVKKQTRPANQPTQHIAKMDELYG